MRSDSVLRQSPQLGKRDLGNMIKTMDENITRHDGRITSRDIRDRRHQTFRAEKHLEELLTREETERVEDHAGFADDRGGSLESEVRVKLGSRQWGAVHFIAFGRINTPRSNLRHVVRGVVWYVRPRSAVVEPR